MDNDGTITTVTTVLDFKSRLSRFIGLWKFKREHNCTYIKKFSNSYDGEFGTKRYTVYSVRIEYIDK